MEVVVAQVQTLIAEAADSAEAAEAAAQTSSNVASADDQPAEAVVQELDTFTADNANVRPAAAAAPDEADKRQAPASPFDVPERPEPKKRSPSPTM